MFFGLYKVQNAVEKLDDIQPANLEQKSNSATYRMHLRTSRVYFLLPAGSNIIKKYYDEAPTNAIPSTLLIRFSNSLIPATDI